MRSSRQHASYLLGEVVSGMIDMLQQGLHKQGLQQMSLRKWCYIECSFHIMAV